MKKFRKSKSVLILCSSDGIIEDIINDGIRIKKEDFTGKPFSSLLASESFGKSILFLESIKKEKFAQDFELFLNLDSGNEMLLFSGVKLFDKSIIIATNTYLALDRLFEEMSKIVNEQTNNIRELVKRQKKEKHSNNLGDAQYNELISINNELVNTQRELSKKNYELERLNKKLGRVIKTDSLTGIFNRVYFYEKIEEEIGRASRLNYYLTVVYIDINNFKAINDNQGHDVGDKVLVIFADISKKKLRKGLDFAFRLGGDEFVYLLTNCNENTAEKIVNRIKKQCADMKPSFSISYGIAGLPVKKEKNIIKKIDKYLKIADKRMYEQKKSTKRQ